MSEKNKYVFSIPVNVEKVGTRMSDDSVVVTISTQSNIGLEKEAFLLSCRKKLMNMFLSEAELTDEGVLENMPEPIAKPRKGSPSQELRNALFGYHKALDSEEEFDSFYDRMMKQITEHYRNKSKELQT